MAEPNFDVLRDPLQGYDVNIIVSGNKQLVGAFTSLMFKVVNQTETYLPVNSRIPRMLDGELIVVWSLEQGLVNLNLIANTFGGNFANEFAKARGQLIPRSSRFDIRFHSLFPLTELHGTTDIGMNTSPPSNTTARPAGNGSLQNLNHVIEFCRVDTYSFGVTSGRHVVANAWQGTGQHIKEAS